MALLLVLKIQKKHFCTFGCTFVLFFCRFRGAVLTPFANLSEGQRTATNALCLALSAGNPYIRDMPERFDPAKDAINQGKHHLSLAFGDKIFEDDDHLILPTIREQDGEERFKVIGLVNSKLYTGVFIWRDDLPRFISVRRSNRGEEQAYRNPL